MKESYYENTENNYDHLKKFFIENQEKLDQTSIDAIISDSPKSLLDIGSGTGDILYSVANKLPDTNIIAIEPNKGMLQNAKTKYRFPDNVTLQETDLGKFNTSDKFEKIFLGLVYHNFKNKAGALTKIYNLLENGGTLVITDFVKRETRAGTVKERQEAVERAVAHNVPPHVALEIYKQEISDDTVTRKELEQQLKNAGFNNLEEFWDEGSYYGVIAKK